MNLLGAVEYTKNSNRHASADMRLEDFHKVIQRIF